MKKILLMLWLLPTFALAQSKEATEEWILAQASKYHNLGITYTIEGDDFIRRMSAYGQKYKFTIPIKKVKTISIEQTDRFLSFRLMCEDDCAYIVTTDDNDKFVSDAKSESVAYTIFEKLDQSLVPRLQKAFLNLVATHGGKAKMVPHKAAKEAF
jgi:hypothetical protein